MRLLIFLAIVIIYLTGQTCGAKTGRTYFTDEQVRQARENVQKYDWAKAMQDEATKPVEWVLNMSDEELWDFIPPAEQPRGLNVHFGADCPIHGKEIHKVGANYPWIIDRNLPFKVKCPVGGEIYPSNDFKPWGRNAIDSKQKYADDGFGWEDENGNRYWFVAHYIFWQRWRTDILPIIPKLTFAYLLTGDTRYSHKAAVMLARVAQEYPKMEYGKQSYHNGNWPNSYSGKILDLDWEGSGTIVPLTLAYDQMYDALDEPELKSFLAGKGISNPRDFIEANFLQEAARAIESNIVHGNMNYQNQLAIVATVLDNHNPAKGYTTEQMVDWIMNRGGEMNTLIYNGVSRDGAGSEESIGYTTIWTRAFLDLAETLKPLGHDLSTNPHLRKMPEFYIQTAVADKFAPKIGDMGEVTNAAGRVWGMDIFASAYKLWGDPIFAKALNTIGWPAASIYDKPEDLEKIKTDAEKYGQDIGLKTRDLGGFGLAVLESGEKDNKRAVSMFYGSSGAWHGHSDRLNIGMWSRGKEVLPDLGYPLHWGSKAEYWTRSTPCHYCVLIDENRQQKKAGHLSLLAVSPDVQVMDASDEDAYRGVASLYRRTVAMVDVSPEDSYLVDIFRVKGGSQHDYSFHGLPFGKLTMSGVELGPTQAKGTLMGKDVEFDAEQKDGMKTGGYQYLFNPRRGNPTGKWSADWLREDTGQGLRMTMLPGSAQEVIVADSEPDAKPGYPEKMEYIYTRNKGGSSAYVSIVEPYQGKPFIKRVQPLKSEDGVVGVQVDSNGRTDYVLSSMNSLRISDFGLRNGETIRFQGEFGAVSEDTSGIRSMFLVNGGRIEKDGYAINAAPLKAKIAEVDYKGNSITLDRKLPIPDAVVGQVVAISNPLHSTSYTITKAETKGGRTVLHFGDISPIEGFFGIKAIDDNAKTIQTSSRLSGYGIKWDGKFFPGYTILNDTMTESWPIADYDNAIFTVKADGDLSTKFKDKAFYIADIGPGDEVMIPATASIKRTDTGAFEVHATVPFELVVPLHSFQEPVVECLIKGEWKPMKAERRSGTFNININRGILLDGSGEIRIQ